MHTTPDEKLLEKFLDNKCTPEEARDILEWVSSPEGRLVAENRFNKDIVLMENSDQHIDNQEIRTAHMFRQIMRKIFGEQEEESTPQTRRLIPNWLKIAAAILIPLFLTNAIIWFIFEKPNKEIAWQEVSVPKGEKQQVIFQDGTRIWLNSDTKLKYPVEFSGNQREVKLDGEAYFQVKKNAKKPFFVRMNNLSIKVTGTSFNVKAYHDENVITTALDEGKVSLLTQLKNESVEYTLQPGQEAFYSKNSSAIEIQRIAKGQNSLWKEKKIKFKDTPLFEVIKVLERWYNVKFVVMDQGLSEYTYTITFHNEPLQNVLTGLQKITPIKYQINNGIVEVRKMEIRKKGTRNFIIKRVNAK
jgi:ferric-dicitrate binding protein FerR (iron transport regulator)